MPHPPTSSHVSSLLVRWLPFAAFCAVIAYYFWFVNSLAINIPFQDDVYDFLQFVILADAAESPAGAFKEWFKQYLDHRTNAQRLIVYGTYLIEGEVNFRTLTLLANLALPLILLLLYLSVRGEEYRWIFLLVSALILLSLRTPILMLHSQGAFAYYFVVFYTFACLFALHKVTVLKFVLAAMLCTLATFTFAAGQIAWFLGLTSLLHQCLVTGRRSPIYPAIWLLLTVAVLMVWRVGFLEVGSVPAPELPPEQSKAIAALFPDLLVDPPLHQALARHASWFLVMLGCAFIDSSALGAGVVGLVMLVVLLFVTIRFYKHEDIRLTLCCWFVVGIAAAVSLGRAMFATSDHILEVRYSFFAMVLMATLTLLLQVRFRVFSRPPVYLVVLLAGMYWVWTYSHFESSLQYSLRTRYADFNNGDYSVYGKLQTESTGIVNAAISAGIYTPPCRPFPACETLPHVE